MLRKQPQPVRHEHLAAELTDASVYHAETVAESHRRFAVVRDSVIDRATQRRNAINDIQMELDREDELLASLIAGVVSE